MRGRAAGNRVSAWASHGIDVRSTYVFGIRLAAPDRRDHVIRTAGMVPA